MGEFNAEGNLTRIWAINYLNLCLIYTDIGIGAFQSVEFQQYLINVASSLVSAEGAPSSVANELIAWKYFDLMMQNDDLTSQSLNYICSNLVYQSIIQDKNYTPGSNPLGGYNIMSHPLNMQTAVKKMLK